MKMPLDDDARPVYNDPLGEHTMLQWMAWAIYRRVRHYRGWKPVDKLSDPQWSGHKRDRHTDWDDYNDT